MITISKSRTFRLCWASLASLSLLSACGGGSSDGGTSGSEVPQVSAQITAQLLDTFASPITSYAADIDDSGRVFTVFSQSNGTRVALMATVASPGARGVAATASAPEVIDAAMPFDPAGRYTVSVSANGNAVALWEVTAPCSAATYKTTGDCRFVYAARRLAGSFWEAPLLVGDAPLPVTGVVINDSGDIAVNLPAWARSGESSHTVVTGAAWKPSGQAAFQRQALPAFVRPDSTSTGLTLGTAGNMVLVSPSIISGTVHLVAVRGDQANGFGPTEVLDTATANVGLEGIWGGINGQVVVFWQQAEDGGTVRWAATLDTSAGEWSTTRLGTSLPRSPGDRVRGAVTDAGNFIWYDLENCIALRRVAGAWQTATSLASGVCPNSASYVAAVSRTGDVLGALASATATAGNTGQWLAYEASTNTMVQPLSSDFGTGYLFALPSAVGGRLLLSENGVGALVSANTYEVMPSLTAPQGVNGTQLNLWAVYIKLQ